MFLVGGRLRVAKDLDDGKVAYWRGPDVPAAILTREQLENVQRMNGARLLIPYALFAVFAALVFLWLKAQWSVIVPALFGMLAIGGTVYVGRRTTAAIAEILDQAPREPDVPPHVPASMVFRSLWRRQDRFPLLVATWLTGFILFVSTFGLVAKLLSPASFDPNDKLHPMVLAAAALVSCFLFFVLRRELHRRDSCVKSGN